MKITAVEVESRRVTPGRYRVPLGEAAPASGSVTAHVVRVRTDAGLEGIGFTHTTAGAAAVESLLTADFAPLLVGEDPLQTDRHFSRAQAAFGPVGFSGLAARAYAALDIALWDLKGKAAGVPLYRMLGGSRNSAPFFVSDAATLGRSWDEAMAAGRPLLDQGAMGLLVEIGSGHIERDGRRVERAREALGDDGWMGVTAGQRFDLATALAVAHFLEEDVGIDWFEDPLPAEDRKGYARLAERMEVPLAAGATFDSRELFLRLLEAGDVRVLRPDVLRLGGITPLLMLAALADAFPVTLCPYRLPEVGVHLACGLPNVPTIDFTSTLTPLFAIPLLPENGRLTPPDLPGLGLAIERPGGDR